MTLKVRISKQVASTRKQAAPKKVRVKAIQRTCVCDFYWFPHRYQFTKCPGDLWDKIALELGFTKKIVNPKKCPF